MSKLPQKDARSQPRGRFENFTKYKYLIMITNSMSKSDFMVGLQCPKMLWLKGYRQLEVPPPSVNENVLYNGRKVGETARGIFGEYFLVDAISNDLKIKQTQH